METYVVLLIFMCALPFGRGNGFFAKLANRGRNENNQGHQYEDICETVRIMPRIAMAVVGGVPMNTETSAPYIAAVGERISNGSISWFCGGSLISPHHILTAAHCLVSRNVSTIRLGSFSTKKGSTENDYEVSETIIHPGYKITESYNDLGVIKVKSKIIFNRNIKPVCLPENDRAKYDREHAKVIGWGAEEFGGEGSQKLQQVEVEVFTNSYCEKAYRNSTIAPKTFPKGIKTEQLCAGSRKGGKDACQGDSGGPLVLTDEHGIVRQIGVVSTGAGCGFKMYPGVYTRVSSYIAWVQEQMKYSSSPSSPQKNNSTEPSEFKDTSTEPQFKGTLLNSGSSNHSRNKTQTKPHQSQNGSENHFSSVQGKKSKETHSANDFFQNENIGKNNKNSSAKPVESIVSSTRKPDRDSREITLGGKSDHGQRFEEKRIQQISNQTHPRSTIDQHRRVRRYLKFKGRKPMENFTEMEKSKDFTQGFTL